jgi:hypothetical protein
MNISIPKPKLPKINVGSKTLFGGKGGIPAVSVPTFSVDWFATGGIVKGSNGGTVVGIGENGGDEAIVPLSNKSRMRPFAEAIAGMIGGGQQTGNSGPVVNLTLNYSGAGSQEDANDMLDFVERGLNDRLGIKLRMKGARA